MPPIPTVSPRQTNGFGDSFGVKSSRFRSTLKRPSSGFGDSFPSAPSPSSSVSPRKCLSSTSQSDHLYTFFGLPKTTSPAPGPKRNVEPSSSIPDGEVNFETRFPSFETISGEAFSAPFPPIDTSLDPSSSQPSKLISPVTSPPVTRPCGIRQLSMMGSLTGGASASAHLPASAKADGAPQPHSTHVTGTAFKSNQDGMLSPSIVTANAGYFSSMASENSTTPPGFSDDVPKFPMPQDLMAGDESSDLLTPSMRPGVSTRPTSSGAQLLRTVPEQPKAAPSSNVASASVPPVIEQSRPLLPQLNSSRPTSNTNSEQWSPLKRLHEKEKVSSTAEEKKEISSDEEQGPEEASANYPRPSSAAPPDSTRTNPSLPRMTRKMSAFEKAMAGANTSDRSPEKPPQKAVTTPFPADHGETRPSARRLLTSERARPQSMYAAGSSTSSRSLLSPPAVSPNASLPPESATSGRPSHIRKGSITDIVTRFESLNPPAKPANGATNGLSRKSAVAAKPTALRKPTSDEKRESIVSTSPTKATSPIKAPKPVRYGQTPVPAGSSRSSSGRSFPVTKPPVAFKPAIKTSLLSEEEFMAASNETQPPPLAETTSSPEKQQSVNSLIQRWNQGGAAKSQR